MTSLTHTNKTTEKSKSPVVHKLAVWPVHTQQDYEKAQAVVEKLILLEKPSDAESQRLDIMLTLMEAYEHEQSLVEVSNMDPLETLRFLMDQHGMNASDLGRLIGNRSLGSAILRGARSLSKSHIKTLSEHFRVTPELFFE